VLETFTYAVLCYIHNVIFKTFRLFLSNCLYFILHYEPIHIVLRYIDSKGNKNNIPYIFNVFGKINIRPTILPIVKELKNNGKEKK